MLKKINLSLPKNWNSCSIEQLELIADVMREQIERADRYHPFSMYNVKVALFFALSGIVVVDGPNPRIPIEEQYYTCRLNKRKDTFSLYLWQINYWLCSKVENKVSSNKEVKKIFSGEGLLEWLDNDIGSFLTKFPYKKIVRKKSMFIVPIYKTFKGPLPELEGFSWSQYRLAVDAMRTYVQLSNSLIKMKMMNAFSDGQMLTQKKSVDLAKSMFLATIFTKKTKYVDTNTGIVKKNYHYESNQITDNTEYFRNFPETQWQVILFWWTGIMHSLSKRYPHVFRVQKVDKYSRDKTPLDIYSATIATMQKYVGLDENQCNNQSYSLVLEQLERMSKENEELERIRHKR